MKTSKIVRTVKTEFSTTDAVKAGLPLGTYTGLWGGYEISGLCQGDRTWPEICITTDLNIRGKNHAVIVTVGADGVTFGT